MGNVEFIQLGVRIIEMEISLVRKEYFQDELPLGQETLHRKQLIDGVIYRGDFIQFSLDLATIAGELTPTMESLNNTLSVRYFISFLLRDEQNRKYYKQVPIVLSKGTSPVFPNLPSYRFGLVHV